MHGPVLFTTPPRPAQSVDPLDELFAPTGLGDELGSVRTIDRRFRLGLLPSGWGIGAVSVSTIAPPLIVGMLLSSRRRPSAFARPDRSRPPAYPKADDQ